MNPNIQSELFPSPDTTPNHLIGVDGNPPANEVMQSPMRNSHVEQHRIVRPAMDVPLDFTETEGDQSAVTDTDQSAQTETPDGTADNSPRLADPDLHKVWLDQQARKGSEKPAVSTDDLSSAEKNANVARAEAAHRARTQRQIFERTE